MMIRQAIAVLLVSLLVSCASPPRPKILETPSGFGDFWDGFAEIAASSGYYLDQAMSDRGMRVFVSRWIERPAPFGIGNRTRLHGKFTRGETIPDGWHLEFWVERQIVKDISRGFEAKEPDWSDGGQDHNREEFLMAQLSLRFGSPLQLSNPPREQR